MDKAEAEKILRLVPAIASVVDIGGGASPFPRANYVVDAIPFDDRAQLGTHDLGIAPQFNRDTWVQVDLCEHKRWPFEDNQFDFSTCSHLLEDVRDPIWICSELSRISKAGYIEVPSRVLEQTLGIEHPSYAGYYHHRWLVSLNDGMLEFRHKPHLLHSCSEAIVARVGVLKKLNPKHAISTLWWTDTIRCTEILEFSEDRLVSELCQFAKEARELPELTVDNGLSLTAKLKRSVYYNRLKRGRR